MTMSDLITDAPSSTERDPRWAAVVARSAEADGTFFYSVRTTGVYCRPSCGAAGATRERAVPCDREDAERAGFRPCKRCKPDQPALAEQHAAKVAEACRLIETRRQCRASTGWRTGGAEPLSLPSRVQGGDRPDAAAPMRRRTARERVRGELARHARRSRRRSTARATTPTAGSTTSSGEMLGMTPTDYRAGGANAEIRFAVGECSLGAILVAAERRAGCAPSCSATTRTRWCATSRTGSRSATLIGGDAGIRATVARRWWGSSRRPRSASICRSTCAAPRSSSASGRRCGRSPPARRRATRRSRSGSARRRRCAPWRRRAGRIRSRWRSRATAWCGTTARCRAIAGASSGSARCCEREASA